MIEDLKKQQIGEDQSDFDELNFGNEVNYNISELLEEKEQQIIEEKKKGIKELEQLINKKE